MTMKRLRVRNIVVALAGSAFLLVMVMLTMGLAYLVALCSAY